ncbi:MAG TPA: UDP-N-acetylmuramate--L-alanine ligase, partial [Gemmatimonadaceae bacterium]|nr:UDP-N-acetylmuramate--L-alanine ligase [Gemmatimonadaceae bacterium]
MPLLDDSDSRPIHFIGIAGAGMSALAELCRRRGAAVTGCDAHAVTSDDLDRLGIPVALGHDPAHLDGVRAVVVSSAIPRELPEVVRARELGLPVIRRAEALAEATAGGDELIAIAGTAGKTTTTVMTTEALTAAGRAPTGVAGGRVSAWHGNLRFGSDRLFVVEADEYDRSFLALTPTVAVVTNIEADHLDIYRDLADIRDAFATFVRPAKWIILGADDAEANTLPTPSSCEVVRFGTAFGTGSTDARLVARDIRVTPVGSTFDVVYDRKPLGQVQLQTPGLHNVRNALAAIGVGIAIGVPLDALAPGLAAFRGVERRFQRLGEARGAVVVDDYAHHPTKIRATIEAARAAYPARRLVVAFQPHLFSRTRDFAQAFGEALAMADVVLLADIYPAREQPIPGVTSALIAEQAARAGRTVAWQGPRSEMARALAGMVQQGDVVLTVGAGDVTETGPELLALLGASGVA